MKKLNKNNEGFSLVEIIVAVVILGIIAVPLLHTLLVGAKTAGKSADVQDATSAAQNLMEILKAKGADTVFDNPVSLINGAEEAENSLYRTKIVEISNYISGTREYRAVVTIDAAADENELALSKSNRMDVSFNMNSADDSATNDYRDKSAVRVNRRIGLTNYDRTFEPDGSLLRRSDVEITASRTSAGEGLWDYTITATFHYHADASLNNHVDTVRYWAEYKEIYVNYPSYDGTQTSTLTVQGVKAPDYGNAAFSVFLLYDAYWRTTTQNITINNSAEFSSEADFNVFLVNTADANAKPAGYSGYNVNYKYQHFNNNNETCVRVFSNMQKPLSYYAFKTASQSVDLRDKVTGQLVETAPEQRRYRVNIKLYKPGETDELVSLDAEMIE